MKPEKVEELPRGAIWSTGRGFLIGYVHVIHFSMNHEKYI